MNDAYLGDGFKHFLFLPLPGEMIQFDLYFSDGLKPPPSYILLSGQIIGTSAKVRESPQESP